MGDALSSRIPPSSKCFSGSSTCCSSNSAYARFGRRSASSTAAFFFLANNACYKELLQQQKGLCLAGQADALFVDSAGDIVILDWKRTKSIRFDNAFRSLKEPLQHLPDSNGWLYSLQLNVPRGRQRLGALCACGAYGAYVAEPDWLMLKPSVAHCWVYKYMLETEYGLRVSSMYLGQVHPCLPRAMLIEVPCMRDELQLIVDDQIDLGEAISGALPDARFALPEQKRVVQTELVCARVHLIYAFAIVLHPPCASLSLPPLISLDARPRGSRRHNVSRQRCPHSTPAIPSLAALD